MNVLYVSICISMNVLYVSIYIIINVLFVSIYISMNNNNNNKHFFNLQVANSPSRLRFEANLSRESSECTEHSQDQTSQINVLYVSNLLNCKCFILFNLFC